MGCNTSKESVQQAVEEAKEDVKQTAKDIARELVGEERRPRGPESAGAYLDPSSLFKSAGPDTTYFLNLNGDYLTIPQTHLCHPRG
jgi:hypothetical protein